MQSMYASLKPEAVRLRKRGYSVRAIEMRLSVPRSTLSGWLKSVPLTEAQKVVLKRKADRGLVQARKKAVQWHNEQKEERVAEAARQGAQVLDTIPKNPEIQELALAMLYLGEGTKSHTTLASSDVRIARFFVSSLQTLYDVPTEKIRCHLHLRSDQDPESLALFWSKALGLPLENFGKALIDRRTIKTKTYDHYKGVCSISCGRVAIQRRLMYIANGFCDGIASRANQGD
ncbi:MAG TPA: hypothetical protein VF829_01485 [Candidatus Paceibacterota bacterium]